MCSRGEPEHRGSSSTTGNPDGDNAVRLSSGPPRLPIYGGYLHLLAYNYRYTHKGLLAMAARYRSPVLGMYVGSDPTIITTDWASTRELLLKPEFQGRPDLFAARLRSFDELLGEYLRYLRAQTALRCGGDQVE